MPTPSYNITIAALKMIISPLHFLWFLSYTETGFTIITQTMANYFVWLIDYSK